MRPNAEPSLVPSGPFSIGRWIVHPERNCLESPDETRHLEPKTMDLLVLLARRNGEVVSKDELIDGVWEGRIISEGTLTNSVAELRSALGDDARNPSFVETIPKRGYRLICPVEQPVHEPRGVDTARGRRRRRLGLVVVATAAVVMAALLFIRSRQPPPDPHVVLVSPFANRTGDPSLDSVATLARDRLVGQLTGSGLARPVPVGLELASATVDQLCERARSEGAGLALSGALYLHEGDVEVQAHLVDVSQGELLYGISDVTGPKAEVAASLDEAVQLVLGAMATHLHAHAHSSLLSRPPAFDAYREFMAGSELFPRDMEGAIRHLRKAVEIDPEFTSAQMRLAMGLRYVGRAEDGHAILDNLQLRRGELTDFERLWLDSFLAEFDGRWADAVASLTALLQLAPSDWTVLQLIATRELRLNRPRRAIGVLTELHASNLPEFVTRHPFYARTFAHLPDAHHRIGDHASELEAATGGLSMYPAESRLVAAQARALAVFGNREGLDELLARISATPNRHAAANAMVQAAASARVHGHPGLSHELAARAAELLEPRTETSTRPYDALTFAKALVLLDRLDHAQTVLEQLVPAVLGNYRTLPVVARGWLGSVAARRGDLETARAQDRALAEIHDPYLYGRPSYYRASIAAWLGHRDEAVSLLGSARAEGWFYYYLLHDEERVLFKPLEGMPEYEAMLRPTE